MRLTNLQTIAAEYTRKRENLDPFFEVENKLFWKTVKPFFSNKGSDQGNIKLLEGDESLQDDSEVVEELNNFFKENF